MSHSIVSFSIESLFLFSLGLGCLDLGSSGSGSSYMFIIRPVFAFMAHKAANGDNDNQAYDNTDNDDVQRLACLALFKRDTLSIVTWVDQTSESMFNTVSWAHRTLCFLDCALFSAFFEKALFIVPLFKGIFKLVSSQVFSFSNIWHPSAYGYDQEQLDRSFKRHRLASHI